MENDKVELEIQEMAQSVGEPEDFRFKIMKYFEKRAIMEAGKQLKGRDEDKKKCGVNKKSLHFLKTQSSPVRDRSLSPNHVHTE